MARIKQKGRKRKAITIKDTARQVEHTLSVLKTVRLGWVGKVATHKGLRKKDNSNHSKVIMGDNNTRTIKVRGKDKGTWI